MWTHVKMKMTQNSSIQIIICLWLENSDSVEACKMINRSFSHIFLSRKSHSKLIFPCVSFQEKNYACLYAECKYVCILFRVYIKGVIFYALFYTFRFLFVFIHLIYLEDLTSAHTDLPYSFSWLHRILLYFILCSLRLIFELIIFMIQNSKCIKSWARKSIPHPSCPPATWGPPRTGSQLPLYPSRGRCFLNSVHTHVCVCVCVCAHSYVDTYFYSHKWL